MAIFTFRNNRTAIAVPSDSVCPCLCLFVRSCALCIRGNMHINSVVIVERYVNTSHSLLLLLLLSISITLLPSAIMHRTSGQIQTNELDFICLIWLWWCGRRTWMAWHTDSEQPVPETKRCTRYIAGIVCDLLYEWYRCELRVRCTHRNKLHYNICYATTLTSNIIANGIRGKNTHT